MVVRKFNFKNTHCQEVVSQSEALTIECGRPGAKVIWFNHDGRNVYVMCDMCADHSLKNRGAIELVPKQE